MPEIGARVWWKTISGEWRTGEVIGYEADVTEWPTAPPVWVDVQTSRGRCLVNPADVVA